MIKKKSYFRQPLKVIQMTLGIFYAKYKKLKFKYLSYEKQQN